MTVAEVKEVMDDAIRHSQKASAKKLMRKVFGRNTDESDRIILSEKDFNIYRSTIIDYNLKCVHK